GAPGGDARARGRALRLRGRRPARGAGRPRAPAPARRGGDADGPAPPRHARPPGRALRGAFLRARGAPPPPGGEPGPPPPPFFTRRLGYMDYDARVAPPVRLPRRPTPADLDAASAAVLRAMEAFVRANPTQWFHFE